MRPTLPPENLSTQAGQFIENFHAAIVQEVQEAIKNNKIVVVGMAHNPFVIKARKLLQEKGLTFKYLEYGNYFSQWKPRLAIKLWSGWPTFPQIFIDGKLIGGYVDLVAFFRNTNTKS